MMAIPAPPPDPLESREGDEGSRYRPLGPIKGLSD